MRNIQKTDFIGQSILGIAAVAALLIPPHEIGFVLFYFVLGGWQLTFTLIRSFFPGYRVSQARRRYNFTLVCLTACLGLTLLFKEALIVFLLCMLIIGPVMALLNYSMTLHEYRSLRQQTPSNYPL